MRLFDRVYEYTQKPDLLKELLGHLTDILFIIESYEGAYLYGWMLIENFLDQIWEEYIESLQRSKQDKQALKDHRSWITYHHIEMLSEIGKINPIVRNLLNKLRKNEMILFINENQLQTLSLMVVYELRL